MELTGFRIDYTDRVVQPITNYAQVMGNPFYDQLVNYQPTAEDQERIISNAKFYNFTGVPYDPNNVVAIIYGYYVNVARQRSEEHTSELQSLMRISYAVFCLKKKK